MSCCTKTYNLGCFNNCSIIAVGLCETSGTYNGVFTYGNISTTITVTAIENEPFLFDLSLLNENATFTLAIYDENENQITLTIDSVDYDCFKVKTQVDSVKVTQGTIIGCTPMCKEIYDPNDENTAVLFTVAVDGTTITGDGTVDNPLEVIGGGSNPTTTTIGILINSALEAVPNDTDYVATAENAGLLKKISWTNVKAFLKTYFDLIYTTTSAVATQITTALSGYATESWVSSQGFIINVISALGYTPANKAGDTFTGSISATNLSGNNTGDQDLSSLIVKNTSITGSTKTKITYDSKGLVTSGSDATTADIADSTDKRYVTDAELTVIGNTSGTNTGDDAVNSLYSGLVSNATHTGEVTGSTTLTLDKTAITNKTTVTVANDDYVLISDTSDSGNLKKALKSDFGGGGSSSLSGLTAATAAATLANGTNVITWNWSGLSAGTKGMIFGGTDILVNGITIGVGKNQNASNVAIGINALNASTGGLYNTAIGSNALNKLTNGLANTAIGESSLATLTTGAGNIAIGRQALNATSDGQANIGIGDSALTSMGTAACNVAIGKDAMYYLNTGNFNVAIGHSALVATKGGNNTGIGYSAGSNLTTGTNNTIIGYYTGLGITTGGKNTIIGASISGLATSLSNTIILADGDGVIRYYCNSAGSTGIGTSTPNASAKLDVSSTTQGVLLPRMTTTQKNAISSPVEGLEVYDLTLHQKSYYNGTTWINY